MYYLSITLVIYRITVFILTLHIVHLDNPGNMLMHKYSQWQYNMLDVTAADSQLPKGSHAFNERAYRDRLQIATNLDIICHMQCLPFIYL